jgi:hypothetical protein
MSSASGANGANEMRYILLQRTPCPGYWEAMPTYQLQRAEFCLKLGRYYHERALKIGRLTRELYLYSWEDANRILDYWRENKSWAEYRLLAFPPRANE